MKVSKELECRAINAIRFLSADAVQKANSGHPGLPMGAATLAYVVWTHHLRFNPQNPKWPGRDRFILSGGHGSALIYSLLYLSGYDLPLEQLMNFRQWRSLTPGHPEYGLTPGVEVTTGPLGQGFGNGVGMAIAEAHLAAEFNRPGFDVVNHYVYAIVTDGDLMEGVASEAASLAGHLQLGKLIYLYDDNRITIDGSTDLAFTEDRPSLIVCRTHIGYGLPTRQDTAKAHGEPPGQEELDGAKKNLGWPIEPKFYVPDDVLVFFRMAIKRGKRAEKLWREKLKEYLAENPQLDTELERRLMGELPEKWDAELPIFPADSKGMATRAASGNVINTLAGRLPELMG
jgi:transketolase